MSDVFCRCGLVGRRKKTKKLEMTLSFIISFATAIFFFVIVPAFFFTKMKPFVSNLILLNILEGCIRLECFSVFFAAHSSWRT